MGTPSNETVFIAHLSPDGTQAQTVKIHLQNTARRAEAFARPFGGQEQARLAGILHDLGKYSDAFHQRLAGGPKVDHSTAGAKEAAALRQLETAFAVAGHHGGLPDGGARSDAPGAPTLHGRLKKQVPSYDAWRSEIRLPLPARPPKIACDGFSASFYIRMLYSCLVDADYLDTEAFMYGAAPRGDCTDLKTLLAKLERHVAPWWDAKTELNKKRCGVLKTCLSAGREFCRGLYTLTVPTGGGKTVSSLAFALHHAVAQGMARVIYVIPYTSIIDQTAEVFREILGDENVIEHHSGADFTVPDGRTDPDLYRKALATENWDAPVIVTTAVQFFESLFSNRSSRCRKLHNIADSVIIFDEAQTLPVSHLRPCVAAIGQLVRYYSATAVLCTATQPALQPLFEELKTGLALREICPNTENLFHFFRRTTLRHAGQMTAEALAASLNSLQQTLCVVNRRETTRRLFDMMEPEGRYCLSTLLCPADRKRLLAEIRARLETGRTCRVVSTSLIEAGVDVDFPTAWREEAGLDSVLQTAGRCNREGTRPAAQSIVTVFRLDGQSAPAIIRQNVDAFRSILTQFDDPAIPAAIERYFSFYRTLKGDAALDRQGVLDAFNFGLKGNIFPFATVSDNFHLIERDTVTVYIPVAEGIPLVEQLRKGDVSRALFRRLGQFAVQIYPEHLQKLAAAGAVEPAGGGSFILTNTDLYSRSTGLMLDVGTGNGLFV